MSPRRRPRRGAVCPSIDVAPAEHREPPAALHEDFSPRRSQRTQRLEQRDSTRIIRLFTTEITGITEIGRELRFFNETWLDNEVFWVGQAFQPDVRNVRLESLTYNNAAAGSVRRPF